MRAFSDILLVTGGRNSGDFLRLLANGKEFGLKHLNYTYQEGEGGIADALGASGALCRWRKNLRDPRATTLSSTTFATPFERLRNSSAARRSS